MPEPQRPTASSHAGVRPLRPDPAMRSPEPTLRFGSLPPPAPPRGEAHATPGRPCPALAVALVKHSHSPAPSACWPQVYARPLPCHPPLACPRGLPPQAKASAASGPLGPMPMSGRPPAALPLHALMRASLKQSRSSTSLCWPHALRGARHTRSTPNAVASAPPPAPACVIRMPWSLPSRHAFRTVAFTSPSLILAPTYLSFPPFALRTPHPCAHPRPHALPNPRRYPQILSHRFLPATALSNKPAVIKCRVHGTVRF